MDARPPNLRLAAALVGLGAFLLFLVEPLVARRLLPDFGGTAAVWTTAMLCFQALLVGGYALAHVLRRLRPAPRRAAQLALLAAGAVLAFTGPALATATLQPDAPVLGVSLAVLTGVGAPFLLLSTTGPNVARILGGTPYRLYALSNAASLAALLIYPTLIEPNVALSAQATLFAAGFALYALLAVPLVLRDTAAAVQSAPATSVAAPPRPWGRWLALSAVPSGLFLAVTSHLGTNLAPMPLLWVLPLALYLLTLILCFDHPRWYRRALFVGLTPLALLALGVLRTNFFVHGSLIVQVVGICVALFVACMALHGELARLRPEAEGVTVYYLTLAVGGALGGVFVAVVAPLVFVTPMEFPVLIAAAALAVGVSWRREPHPDWRVSKVFGAFLFLFIGLFSVVTAGLEIHQRRISLVQVRSAYGALRVAEIGQGDNAIRSLVHGTIRHGAHFTHPAQRHIPSTYYTDTSGVGRAVLAKRAQGPVRMGVVGLGAGGLADWLRTGDSGVFYEIDPLVEQLARTWFWGLPEAKAQLEVVLGDARRRLAEQPPQRFDLLVMDAFSSDAVPTHLLTRECFDVYRRHLAPHGLLLVHISNRFVQLAPVLAAWARDAGWSGRVVFDPMDPTNPMHFASKWAVLAERPEDLAAFTAPGADGATPDSDPLDTPENAARLTEPWTDDYAPMWGLFQWE